MRQFWNIVSEDATLGSIFPNPPQICYRKNPSIGSKVVAAALSNTPLTVEAQAAPVDVVNIDKRVKKCSHYQCQVCPNILSKHVIYSTTTHTKYTLHQHITCTDSNVVYCLLCSLCNKMYIGQTSKNLRLRFRHHRAASRDKRNWPLYRHFSSKNHDFNRDHRIIPLERCRKEDLLSVERDWILKLNTVLPYGLNSQYSV